MVEHIGRNTEHIQEGTKNNIPYAFVHIGFSLPQELGVFLLTFGKTRWKRL